MKLNDRCDLCGTYYNPRFNNQHKQEHLRRWAHRLQGLESGSAGRGSKYVVWSRIREVLGFQGTTRLQDPRRALWVPGMTCSPRQEPRTEQETEAEMQFLNKIEVVDHGCLDADAQSSPTRTGPRYQPGGGSWLPDPSPNERVTRTGSKDYF